MLAPMRSLTRRVVPALLALWVLAARAHAQSTLTGPWQAGATTMDVAIESWGPDCGPRPQSSRSAGGGKVQLQATGDLLVIRGREHDVRSDACWSPNPAIKKVGSSHNKNTWITRCKTGSTDPRQENATYTLRLESPDKLLYEDISHFDWKLKDSTCVATITTTQALLRGAAVPATGPVKPGTPGAMPNAPPPGSRAPTVPPGVQAQTPSCVAGKAARLTLRPHQAELELGGRVCFEARVTDAKNCPLDKPAVTWALDHKPGVTARLTGGCFQAESGSAEGEGSFKITATLGAMHASATVEVSASTLPNLIAMRLEGGAIEGEDPSDGEAGDAGITAPQNAAPRQPAVAAPSAPAPPAARVIARTVEVPRVDNRRSLQVASLLVGALACAFALLFWRWRSLRGGDRPSAVSDVPSPPSAVRSLRCPRCGAFYPEGSAFCGNDGSALEPTR
jgi:hypothetical protein